MLCWPCRSPRSRSSRFPGGITSSRSSRTRFNWSNLRLATGQTGCWQTRRAAAVSAPSNMSAVPRFRKECITVYIIIAVIIAVKSLTVRPTQSSASAVTLSASSLSPSVLSWPWISACFSWSCPKSVARPVSPVSPHLQVRVPPSSGGESRPASLVVLWSRA